MPSVEMGFFGIDRIVVGGTVTYTQESGKMKRIMYIENKSEGLDGPGRIGWVEFSKSGRSFKLYGGVVEIDDDAREEYWTTIRNLPQNKECQSTDYERSTQPSAQTVTGR